MHVLFAAHAGTHTCPLNEYPFKRFAEVWLSCACVENERKGARKRGFYTCSRPPVGLFSRSYFSHYPIPMTGRKMIGDSHNDDARHWPILPVHYHHSHFRDSNEKNNNAKSCAFATITHAQTHRSFCAFL